jgi:hypothetical protein
MVSLFYLLAQAQPQRLPWGFLVLFGIMAIAAVGLLIYFMTRVRRTEKEAEEDWGFSNRGILLNPTTAATSAKKDPNAAPQERPPLKEHDATPWEEPQPKVPEAPVVAAMETAEPRWTVESPAETETAAATAAETAAGTAAGTATGTATGTMMPPDSPAPDVLPERVTVVSSGPEQPLAEIHQEAVEIPAAQRHSELEHAGPSGSPFGEEIWSELESPRPTAPVPDAPRPSAPVPDRPRRRTAPVPEAPRPSAPVAEALSTSPTAAATVHRESYEPPRIDPILPRKDQARRADQPAPEVASPASASARRPAARAALETRPRVKTSIRKPAAAAAGSVLGLPTDASAGPFIIDRSRARADAAEVGTLANYDKPPDDKAGHSGTIALVAALVVVCGSLAAYLTVPPIHSKIDNWVAHVRGIDTSEPLKAVVQIFPAPYDNTKDPIEVKGTLQNISDQSLYGLVVTVSLQPRPGGEQATEQAQVSPDELPPGQQGTYQFQIDGKKYIGYKISALKNKDGVQLGYNKPNQQQ